jgi:hypothetical protein
VFVLNMTESGAVALTSLIRPACGAAAAGLSAFESQEGNYDGNCQNVIEVDVEFNFRRVSSVSLNG